MQRNLSILVFLFWALLGAHGAPTTVTLRSGERLIGEVLPKSNDSTLFLRSALLGELSLARKDVLSVEPKAELARETQPVPPRKKKPEPQKTEAEIVEVEDWNLIQEFRELKAPDSWKGNLRVGVNLSEGDSNWTETFLKGNLIIDPKQSRNYYRFTGSYTYRETERGAKTVKSTDRYDANFTYRRDFTPNFFMQNTLAGRVDQVRGIDRELQELVGAGIRVRPRERMELILGGGAGVEELKANFADNRNGFSAVANIFQEFTWRPFKKATLAQEFNYFVNPERNEQYNYILTTSFRYRLTDLLGVEFSFNQNFDNDIGNGNSKDDTRWRNAIVVYF